MYNIYLAYIVCYTAYGCLSLREVHCMSLSVNVCSSYVLERQRAREHAMLISAPATSFPPQLYNVNVSAKFSELWVS